MVADLSHVALLALLGTGHCVGMCGAFAIAAGSGTGGRARWWARQVAYQVGKGLGYVFVGVAVMAATRLIATRAPIEQVQGAIGWGVGLVMIALGLSQLFERRMPQAFLRWWQGSRACGVMRGLGQSSSAFKGLLIGWINGFLPCGLSFAALLYLVGTQSVTTLVAGALVFSLATLPGLAATAWLLPKLGGAGRQWLMRAAGVLLIALGGLTIVRNRPAVHHWFHEHLMWSADGENTTPDHHH
ncbi:sulfite exporter TauE/SafE family protein [Synoicihabitans lomoniglobus]|uniref:Sulfite exporter TauE/SafE family protein n=1 Tax=Synoicihabitans lomoniglobus TaxID=2909285 RepID=A0AAF0CRR3_9BACT|nr:sulfite exporter TauE/SafE family protein [Opitutaceae bacterium LMO-M01]WED66878.1 sulfite exporter TauE/SafE family protein [Opitutaceae bacterium LMO-M01]